MPGSLGEHDSKRSMMHVDLPPPPCYISSRSADVILSDVRPTKLSTDALDSVNAFLDELLHTILSAARALTTAELRAALHKVLPTTLGKEAVLEAELELRAYWERTGSAPGSSLTAAEDSTCNLQWTFELLRLKCEAYSTLSDTDENSDAETHLFHRMSEEGVSPPKQSLLAPASLYLTAIIESICEHIVSNVGRVAARDSSRAVANGQDLFIALCEDSSIYGLFKNMAVYGQIEALSKILPRSRRSISVAREDDGTSGTGSFRRNGSIHRSRTRLSSDSVSNGAAPTPLSSSRPSVDRSRPVKTLYNKLSQDFINPADPGHRKVDSFASANTKQSLKSDRSPISPTFSEDTRSQEFDDMMRSGSTMKVSLTPDRLRTMEALNKEKEKARANNRQKAPPKTEKSNGIDTAPSHSSPSSPEQPNRTNGSNSTVRRVSSVVGSEDDRLAHKPPPTSRPRQLSAATASGYTASPFTRVRASSTTDPSTALSSMLLSNPTLSESNSVFSDQRPAFGTLPGKKVPPQELVLSASRPLRTRTVGRNRESLDLEDVMAGSDEDRMGELKSPVTSPKQHDWQKGLSPNTKDLIAFLAEGPPELASGENSLSTLSATPKKSGRLQKMISRITLASDTAKPPRKTSAASRDAPSKSMTNLSPLANRPVPPRYVVSGSPSATSLEHDSPDQTGTHTRQRAQSYAQRPAPDKSMRKEAGTVSPSVSAISVGTEDDLVRAATPALVKSRTPMAEIDTSQPVRAIKSSPSPTLLSPPTTSAIPASPVEVTEATPTVRSPPSLLIVQSSKSVSMRQKVASSPASKTPSPSPSVLEHAHDMRTMLEHATSAAECRILVDMFLARSRLVADMALAASLSPRDSASGLESAIVELFLGDGPIDSKILLDSGSVEPGESLPTSPEPTHFISSTDGTAEPGESR